MQLSENFVSAYGFKTGKARFKTENQVKMTMFTAISMMKRFLTEFPYDITMRSRMSRLAAAERSETTIFVYGKIPYLD